MKNYGLIVSIAILMGVSSCEQSEITKNVEKNETGVTADEHYTPKFTGKTIDAIYQGRDVNLMEMEDGKYLYEMDVVLDRKDFTLPGEPIQSSRSTYSGLLWPKRTVRWQYDKKIYDGTKTKWLEAIKEWETKANFKFVEITDSSGDYILLKQNFNGLNHSSGIGRKGGEQVIALNIIGSQTSTAIHEIGHALGLVHEQSRPDRDNYITINYDNIKTEYNGQFKNCSYCKVNGTFDFESVMLYSSFIEQIAIDTKKPVMTRLDGTTFMNKGRGLSEGDIAGINEKYKNQKLN
jgi:hypothetical protein